MSGCRIQSGLILILLLTLSSCGYNSYAPVRDRTSTQFSHNTGVYIVQRGDTLFSVAWQYGLEIQQVAAWNGIQHPYTIYPGQKISLNPPIGRGYAVAPKPSAKVSKSPVRTAPPAVQTKSPSAAAPARVPPPVISGPVRWQWPAIGQVLRRFDADTSGKKGILIGGAENSPVRAAASGSVVYAGSGLVGYGQLIILKHNDTYLSAYGHNRNLLVKEGDEVRAGQVIAHMGSSGTNRTQLHFEIRRNGKPVDPLSYLPRR
jgi:lipoprotein NlpD